MSRFAPIAVAVVVAFGGAVALTNAYNDRQYRATTFIFSERQMLHDLWRNYKSTMLEAETYRTLDKSQGYVTTSEGQSYTMLRAVWMDDKQTFDNSWQWTKDILQRDDKLFAWRFGPMPDGSFNIQSFNGGQNSAVDGDVDIALSLLMAYTRWNETKYVYEAVPIIQAIWDKVVVDIGGRPVLAANDLEKTSLADTILINPSYYAPYAYKLFALVDNQHDWSALSDHTYEIIQNTMELPHESGVSVRLPPNWIRMHRITGELSPPIEENLNTHYGYDAFRTPWRLALDYQWFGDKRAKQLLSNMAFLAREWREDGELNDIYRRDGAEIGDNETAAMYGTAIGFFKVVEPAMAQEVYDRKIAPLYSIDTQQWKTELSYYDDNWAWFGIGLMHDLLPNLAMRKG